MSTLFKDMQINSKTFAQTQLKRMVAEFDGKLTPSRPRRRQQKRSTTSTGTSGSTPRNLLSLGRAAASPGRFALAFRRHAASAYSVWWPRRRTAGQGQRLAHIANYGQTSFTYPVDYSGCVIEDAGQEVTRILARPFTRRGRYCP